MGREDAEYYLTKYDLYDFCEGLYDINTITKYAELGKFPHKLVKCEVRFTNEAKDFMKPPP